jgi:hypothetical protein
MIFAPFYNLQLNVLWTTRDFVSATFTVSIGRVEDFVMTLFTLVLDLYAIGCAMYCIPGRIECSER